MSQSCRAASAKICVLPSIAATLLFATGAQAQEIRRVAEPNQPVRMTHNGYVCAGQLTVSPIRRDL